MNGGRKKKWLTGIIIVCLTFSSFAFLSVPVKATNQYYLRVYVVDDNHYPLSNATIRVIKGDVFNDFTTDSNGSAIILLDEGEYTVKVTAKGMEEQKQISLRSNISLCFIMGGEKELVVIYSSYLLIGGLIIGVIIVVGCWYFLKKKKEYKVLGSMEKLDGIGYMSPKHPKHLKRGVR